MPQPRRLTLAAAVCLLAVSGCSTYTNFREKPPSWLTPYRADIGQGNFITAEQTGRLSVGQSREQVKAVLGTPLLVDPFRANRWDYVFDLRKGGGDRDRRRFFVEFDGDRLVRWEGDELPQVSGDVLLPMRPVR
ncbi:MAG: outer membrane protein assembly factor BamE [Betaproteobacteria bacterium]|nr:outer membrane protein assembly factor BamE [Betaproteobacteria bacterium]NBT74784.1 outer membrane protein assembly factor BamE [Betaproteobacteria bacterium]NBY13658.1 outer membrane protein assembly factor BamE [Betaproteobacteria bacterium]NCA15886.1 outer membrane protein assembly factor BamE [Betaproteobacteria bacterium]